jgi:hypothetical protein
VRDDLDLHGVQDLDPGADSEEARELAAVVALLRSLPEPEPSSDLTARVMTEVRRIESRPRVLRAIFGSRLELNAAMAAGFACIGLGLGLGVIRVPVPAFDNRHIAMIHDSQRPNVLQIDPHLQDALNPFGVAGVIPSAGQAVMFGGRGQEGVIPAASSDPNLLDRHLDSELNALQLDPVAYFRRLERVRQRDLFVRRLAERAARRGDAAQVALSVRSVPHEYTSLMVEQLLQASLIQAVSER